MEVFIRVTFADFLGGDYRFEQLIQFVQLLFLVVLFAALVGVSLGSLAGTLLSILYLLGDVLDKLLLFGPFLVLQAKCLILNIHRGEPTRMKKHLW